MERIYCPRCKQPPTRRFIAGICDRCYNRDLYRKSKGIKRLDPYKEKRRGYWLKYQYGISEEEWEALYTAQQGKCAICQAVTPHNRLHTDHDHTTGKVRGLLCAQCNHSLGFLREDPALFERAAEYLRSRK